MDKTNQNRFMKYLRTDRLPNIFCAGCGNGIIMNTFFNAMEMAEIDFDNLALVSGIGCSSRVPGYIKCDSLHTTHGRPIAFATGLKLANPELDVVVFTGDGDAAAIGGNHLDTRFKKKHRHHSYLHKQQHLWNDRGPNKSNLSNRKLWKYCTIWGS